MDLQRVDLAEDFVKPFLQKKNLTEPYTAEKSEIGAFYKKLFEALGKSKKPLILIGGGVRLGRAEKLCLEFVNLLGIPVIHSLMAVDVLPKNHPLRVGMIGTYGNRWANLSIAESDLMLVLGSRLDIRQTGGNVESFKEGRIIFQVDCDLGEMNNRIKGCITLHADLSDFFAESKQFAGKDLGQKNHSAWMEHIREMEKQFPDTNELKDCPGINPNVFMHQLSAASKEIPIYVTDVGQHQMWAAQSLDLEPHQRFLTSGGMGSMGFSLPAAIGASLSQKKAIPVLVIAGDGAFQLNIQELETIHHNNLPIKMVILNNQSHGMVRQFQESYFNNRFQSTVWGYSAPSFSAVAKAYGIESKTISTKEEVEATLAWLNRDIDQPALLEVMIDPTLNIYPKLAFGQKFGEMEPQAKPLDMEGT